MMKRATWFSLAVVAVGLMLLLGAANLLFGGLNQDEGWYLYAARQVRDGHLLYRDFMFTQGPVLPYLYATLYSVVEKYGLAGGRLISGLFGLAATGGAAWLAARAASDRVRKPAALLLAGVNVYQSYFSVVVKTYAPCAFFLTAGLLALSFTAGRRGKRAALWGGILLALAACTRLSAGVALPVAGLWLLWNRKKVVPRAWLIFGFGGGLILLLGLGSFFLLAPENLRFALFDYHAGRVPGSLLQMLALKAGFISRFTQAYFVFCGGLLLVFALNRLQWPTRERGYEEMTLDSRPRLMELLREANAERSPFARSFVSLLWLCGALITLTHFLAPFPYDDYQVIIYPVLAAALCATLLPHCPDRQLLRASFATLLLCAAAAFSSPLNQEWFVRGRDRIWWKFKETPDLIALRQTAAALRAQLGSADLLLTQDIYLAVEAGARVPHGMEMGPFCYYPQLPREEAVRLNLLNRELLDELLDQAPAPLAAFSGYGLAIRSPEVAELSAAEQQALRTQLETRYRKTGEVPHFGQAHTALELFERKP
jgi:hypothetical protein